MRTKTLTTLFYLAVLWLIQSGCEVKQDSENFPNIIYILADDLGYGDVSCFNPDGKIETPELDRLAKEGIIFTDAHTSSSVCSPTRYGILTGRYSWRSRLKQGVLTGKSKSLIPSSRTTVASMLKTKGYTTAFIGKWHLGWDWAMKDAVDTTGTGWYKEDFDIIDFSKPVKNTPNDLGFDYAYGHAGSLDMAPYVYVENGMATSQPDRTTVNKGQYSWWREGPTGADFIHEEVTPHFFDKADQFIRDNAHSQEPFFLYLALPSPHTPILPLEDWQGKSGLNPYADFVMMIDAYVGRLISTVENAGITQNTLIIFTSDNGCSPEAGITELQELGHFPSYLYRGHKADIFEGGHRVPLIMKWPGVIRDNLTSDQLVSTTDLMATLADITGYSLNENEGADSYSILPYFKAAQTNKPKRTAMVHHSIDGSFAIRKGDWKLIMVPHSGGWSFPIPGKDQEAIDSLPALQLYNLKDDPSEQVNVYNTNPLKVSELKSLLISFIREGRSTPGKSQANDPIDFDWHQIDFMDQ